MADSAHPQTCAISCPFHAQQVMALFKSRFHSTKERDTLQLLGVDSADVAGYAHEFAIGEIDRHLPSAPTGSRSDSS
jgi:hypothetical protein